MMETDEPVSVLTCSYVYHGRQDRKLVKDKQKIADFVPENPEISILLT